MDEEPFSVTLTAGTLDADGGGHVSSVAFPKYLEAARLAYLRCRLGDHLAERNFVLANLDLDYRAELFPGDELCVEVSTVGVGTTSFELAYRLATADAVAAEATTVLVVRDRETGESVRVPDAWRERLAPGATA